MDEVRYHMLRPAQIVERRTACPVAYVPIGTIEWHGVHNPVGADTLQAEGLANLCARKGGGVAFPPLYYGEPRHEALMEATAGDRERIAEAMGLPPENFAVERFPFPSTEQSLNYHRLLLHILGELETLGFRVGVIVAGHYPLIDYARAAVLHWNKREHSRKNGGLLAWACVDYLMVKDRWPHSGDHAGGWETSHCMALHPQTVDLSLLPPKGERLVGAGGHMAPQDATADFGRETMEAAADAVVREVAHRLANPGRYFGHGAALAEGLWKDEGTT